MTARRIRLASILMLGLLLSDTLLAACAGGTSIRRAQEDAMLLMIAGDYQLTGELPAVAKAEGRKLARLVVASGRPQEPTTPSEAWTLFEYYRGLRDAFEQKAKAENLPPDVVAKGIAEYEAKMKALGDKANDLDKRRARHRSTAWKRFFDGLGRFIGRAFEIGGKIVKFAIEDVPTGVGEYAPAVVKGLAQAYVEKLKGELRTKGEQKAFEILVEKSPNLAGAYLIFKAGKSAVKVLRDFARLIGRHRRGGQAAQAPADTGAPGSEASDSGMVVVQIGAGDVQGSLAGSIAEFAPPTMFDLCSNARVVAPITGLTFKLTLDLDHGMLTGTFSGRGDMAQGAGEHPPDSAAISATGSITEGSIEPQGEGWVFFGTGTATLTYEGTYTCATIDWPDKPDEYTTTSGGSASTVEIKVSGDTLGHALSVWTEQTLSGPDANVGFVTVAGWALNQDFEVVTGNP